MTQESSPEASPDPGAGRDLARLGQCLLLGALQRMGVLRTAGERWDADELRTRLGVTAGYLRLFQTLLDVLTAGGFLRRDGGAAVVTPAIADGEVAAVLADPERAWRTLAARHPRQTSVAALLARCMEALPKVLTGERSHLEVLFPDGSLDLVTGVYQGTEVADWCNDRLAQLVRRYVEGRLAADPAARVHVLEVGAGTGGTSGPVLAALAPFAERVRYWYTDISTSFLRNGRRRFQADHPFIDFAVLDLDQPLAQQGFDADSYDIVIGANVLHATRRIVDTLAEVKRVLRAGGLLALYEGSQIDIPISLIFGLTDGWWRYEDEYLRLPGAPLLSAARWLDVLAAGGFQRIAVDRPPLADTGGHLVIAAYSDGVGPAAVPPAPGRPASPPVATGTVADTVVEVVSGNATEVAAGAGYPAVEEYVRGVFARVLEMSAEQLDPAATFDMYGVDSLVALELNRAFEADLGHVPATLLFEHVTIGQLAHHFLTRYPDALSRVLGGQPARPAADPPAQPPVRMSGSPAGDTRAGLSQALDELSDAEVDRLLRLLAPLNGGSGGNGGYDSVGRVR